jgi:hypothetical protein
MAFDGMLPSMIWQKIQLMIKVYSGSEADVAARGGGSY